MNKVGPYINENSVKIVVNSSSDIIMTDKRDKNNGQQSLTERCVIAAVDPNQSHNHIIIPIKEESICKDDNSSQMSVFVKFIKSSFSSHKKKCDPNAVNNQKLIGSLKDNSQNINQSDNTISDNSVPSFLPSTNSSNDISCRFCQEYEPQNEFVTPCLCSGTMKYIHQSCLQRWIKTQDNRFCELCKYEFHMKITTKPLKEWQRLEMSMMERRKIMCSVTFHVIALTCVIWSLYVLIERTTEEMRDGRLEWPFWTKLIVIAIGFIGGIVFMYVQCQMYVSLCRKWHAFNRTFTIQNISATDLITAQRCAKEKSRIYQKTVPKPVVNIYGDILLDKTDNSRNLNNQIAPLATMSNEDLNYSSGTVSQGHVSDDDVKSARCSISLQPGLSNQNQRM